VLTELVRAPDDGIPQSILKRAEGIVVIPTLVKGGFIVGASHGKGVMSIRDQKTGQWSRPAFMDLGGGSVGWQIGVQSTDLVLLVMNRGGLDDLMKSGFKLGGQASVAAGPVGRTAEAATDARFGSKLLGYSRSKGLFAGLSLEGASLNDDHSGNEDFYGRRMGAREVFALSEVPNPPAAEKWVATLNRLAAR
jgi:lipid-binding SYLF domain-containing protein